MIPADPYKPKKPKAPTLGAAIGAKMGATPASQTLMGPGSASMPYYKPPTQIGTAAYVPPVDTPTAPATPATPQAPAVPPDYNALVTGDTGYVTGKQALDANLKAQQAGIAASLPVDLARGQNAANAHGILFSGATLQSADDARARNKAQGDSAIGNYGTSLGTLFNQVLDRLYRNPADLGAGSGPPTDTPAAAAPAASGIGTAVTSSTGGQGRSTSLGGFYRPGAPTSSGIPKRPGSSAAKAVGKAAPSRGVRF